MEFDWFLIVEHMYETSYLLKTILEPLKSVIARRKTTIDPYVYNVATLY